MRVYSLPHGIQIDSSATRYLTENNNSSRLNNLVDNCVLQKVKIDSSDYIVVQSLDSESLLSVTNQDTLVIKSVTKHITNIFEHNKKVNF